MFALQKSEQEDDGEYELDELNTDMEYTETDIESEYDNISRRKSYPPDASEDPTHHLLGVPGTHKTDRHDPFHGTHTCQCQHAYNDQRGAYQSMVVTAVLEKRPEHIINSDGDEIDGNHGNRKHLVDGSHHHHGYYANEVSSDIDSDQELLNTAHDRRSKADAMTSYECIHCGSCNTNNNCSSRQMNKQARSNTCPEHSKKRISFYDNVPNQSSKTKNNGTSCSLYVDLPPEKHKDKEASCYVDLPPKCDDFDVHSDNYKRDVNDDSYIVDLHPRNPRELQDSSTMFHEYNYFHVSNNTKRLLCEENRPHTGDREHLSEVDLSRVSLRSQSVTENLSSLASKHPAPGEHEPQSCPQTPMMEETSAASHDHMVCFSQAYGSSLNRQVQNKRANSGSYYGDMCSSNRQNGGDVSSMTSVDRETGVGFVLSSPYTSVMSLARDNYHNCVTPISEVGVGTRTKPNSLAGVQPSYNRDNTTHNIQLPVHRSIDPITGADQPSTSTNHNMVEHELANQTAEAMSCHYPNVVIGQLTPDGYYTPSTDEDSD